MNKSAHFWDKIAPKYAKQPVGDPEAYERKLAQTQEYLHADMDILELACGTGTTALRHAPFVHHVLAIDLSQAMVGIAQGKAEKANIENVTFKQSSIEDLNEPDARFDMIMAHSILHLVDDRQNVLRETYRMLKPGGYFVSSTVCIVGLMRLLGLVLPIGAALGLLPKVNFIAPPVLLAEMQNAGFSIMRHWQPTSGPAMFIIAQKPL
ncbi:class I SAM-dependent methyltransferase [Magnetovibrio sp. PR-2]|uniref:class I SAM-dependent methyltransferase n=1 Tax=Magnetovibrio sp. PR-2 TaxID=3120356 RepID=UPI002FCE0094